MALTLGIDTGGTYTDAVLFDTGTGEVMAKAKSLTTKHDLTEGVRGAIEQVIGNSGAEIGLVSISTTLATNAIVEGQGSPAALVLIGHQPRDLERPDIASALAQDPAVLIAGGHDATGEETAALDLGSIRDFANAQQGKIAAFAVSAMFAVRNPAHEIAARDLIRAETGLPVTCAHELSSNLDAPRRALTALLNARLIPLIQDLILAVRGLMQGYGIAAPLMVVKGDGSLIEADVALVSPVETIMSGPAASVVGAHQLAGLDDAFVSDIGGTTTDVALVTEGSPQLSRDGAEVGDFRTMVEAVSVHTSGLGGDSELNLDERGRLVAGPRRAVPLSLLASSHPTILRDLERQVERGYANQWDGQFALRQRALDTSLDTMSSSQKRLWERLEKGPVSLAALYQDETPTLALRRLTGRGLVILSRLTPSDAAHLRGLQATWDPRGAELGAELWLRQWQASGHRAPDDIESFCQAVFDAVMTQSARALLGSAVAEEHGQSLPTGRAAELFVDGPLSAQPGRLFDMKLVLHHPIVAIGAPAAAYYPPVGERLGTKVVVPEHAEVCNAVGAVAGGVTQRVDALITSPSEGLYRCHMPDGVADFPDLDKAADHGMAIITKAAAQLAEAAGAVEVTLSSQRDDNVVRGADGLETFIESRLRVTATGRPRLARP